jgi:23S rRNA (cytidine2498-2'-O)-methyltransferase
MDYIITFFPAFKREAHEETISAGGKIVESLTQNISRVSFPAQNALNEKNTVFTRHIHPIHAEGFYPPEKDAALALLLDKTKKIVNLSKNEKFAVQCRIIGGLRDFTAKDAEVFIGSHFDEAGAVPVFSDYGLIKEDKITIISILLLADKYCIGVSPPHENLNFYADEYRILSRASRNISRAENKLKEAIHKFGLEVKQGLALDIGASPGGWSKVLADCGMTVYAVDPGNLSPRLDGNERIIHFKNKIEDLNFSETFDLIVCDMNVDPQITAAIIGNLAPNLRSGARIVITLKMPFASVGRCIDESVKILSENYDILSVKNLTHNRREVTAYLQRR